MDKEFFKNKENCSERRVKASELLDEIKSKTDEESSAELDAVLDEVGNVMKFASDRLNEIVNTHKAISCIGALGAVAGVSFCGKPVTFIGVGTNKALADAFKVIMMGMVSRAD